MEGGALNAALRELAVDYTEALKEQWGESLVSVVLFGSTARGEATPHSDVDLLVVADGLPAGRLARHELLRPADEQLDPRLEALRRVGVLTDICPVLKTPDEASSFTPLFLDMVEDAVILHDRGGFFADVLARLSHALSRLGARRLVRGRVRYWELKPDYAPGEVIVL